MEEISINSYIDYMSELTDEEEQKYARSLLMSYLLCLDILDNNITLEAAEYSMLGGSKNRYPMRAIERVLRNYHAKLSDNAESNKKLSALTRELEKITEGEYSKETKINKMRRTLARFGIQNDIDSYLFEEINDMFEEKYQAIKSYGKRKGL